MGATASARHVVSSSSSAPLTVLAACWERSNAFHVGLLAAELRHAEREPDASEAAETSVSPGLLRELMSLTVPTRAHGLVVEPGGSVLVVARRPGDWLLRWYPDGRPPQWRWIETQRAFNGHAVLSDDGRLLYTTETDLDTGAGCIGVRDARTLAKHDEWPTGGIDAHQLVWDRARPRQLLVANGGVATAPETGRAKLGLPTMDSSLVRLDGQTGRVEGQWRLDDARLSLRHLTWSDDASMTLGIALQSEHDAAEAQAQAPVLSLFDGERLRTAAIPWASAPSEVATPAGYGGDIAALGDGFFVSCPRAPGVAHFSTTGQWRGFTPWPDACALAVAGGRLWTGGRPSAASVAMASPANSPATVTGYDAADFRLDNHWVVVPESSDRRT